jgi:hypothetical protein
MIKDKKPQVAYLDLQVWQKCIDLAIDIIHLIEGLNTNRERYHLIK